MERWTSETAKIHAQLAGIATQAEFLDGPQGFGGDPQIDEAIALGPPKAPILQIHLLQLLGTHMGVADGHAVVGTLTGEFADAGHDRGKRLRPGNGQ